MTTLSNAIAMTNNSIFAEIALDGSMLLAVPVAILAGLVSFSPPVSCPWYQGIWAMSPACPESTSKTNNAAGCLLA
ncbi:hypothetical protein GCM10009771_10650 [Nesterenkonia flava]